MSNNKTIEELLEQLESEIELPTAIAEKLKIPLVGGAIKKKVKKSIMFSYKFHLFT